jgi:hypothetical protein
VAHPAKRVRAAAKAAAPARNARLSDFMAC